MSKLHTWFATKNDAELVLAWMRDAGARQLTGEPLVGEWQPDGRELVLCFPEIGPVEFWPTEIHLADYEENTPRWRNAVLTKIRRQEGGEGPQIDPDKSAVAGLQLPEFRDERYWIAGHICFPTSRLKEVFPELNRLCQRLERYLKRHPIVFDNTKGVQDRGFDYQLCTSGIVHWIVALPEAYALLKNGAFMIDYLVSPKTYSDFRRRLRLSGHEIS